MSDSPALISETASDFTNVLREVDNRWEDVDGVKGHPKSGLRPPSTTARTSRMSASTTRRRHVHRVTSSSQRSSAIGVPSKALKPPGEVFDQSHVLDVITRGACFAWKYLLDVLNPATGLLRLPIKLCITLYLLVIMLNWAFRILHGVFQPLCHLPGVRGSGFCSVAIQFPANLEPLRWADYPKLVDVQSTMFEHLLHESVGGSGVSLEIKKAELATADLVTLVRISGLKSREMLSNALDEFVQDAKKTGQDLQKLTSKVGGAVDNIMAVNDYALHQIESAYAKAPPVLSIRRLIPGTVVRKPVNDVVVRTFGEALSTLSDSMQRLILEAEVNLANLERLEERLSTLHELVSREDATISSAKSELLAELWTKLGGNRKQLRGFGDHLFLLKNLGLYRKKALAHVVGALQSLNAMHYDMEDIRERAAAPALTGSSIPIEVHIKSIKAGLERLQEGRMRAKRLEEDTVRRVLGIAEAVVKE